MQAEYGERKASGTAQETFPKKKKKSLASVSEPKNDSGASSDEHNDRTHHDIWTPGKLWVVLTAENTLANMTLPDMQKNLSAEQGGAFT